MGDLDCVSCVSDGLCVCSFVSVVVCVSPSKICVCGLGRDELTTGRIPVVRGPFSFSNSAFKDDVSSKMMLDSCE